MDAPTTTSPSAEKQARTPPLPYAGRVQLKQDAANMIANMIAASAITGGLGAGAQGLIGMFRRRRLPGFKRHEPGSTIAPPKPEEEEEEQRYPRLAKLAADPDYSTGEWQSGKPAPPPPKVTRPAAPKGPPPPPPEFARNWWANLVGKPIYDVFMKTPKEHPTVFSGDFATDETGVPATWAIGLPASLLALYGGYKGVSALINRRRKAEKEDELADAKRRYAELTRSSAKHASDTFDELSKTCVGELEKQAQSEGQPGGFTYTWQKGLGAVPGAGNLVGSLGIGLPAAYALLSGLGAGALSYDFFKKRSRPAVLKEALKERARRRARQTGGMTAPYFYVPEDEREEEAAA